MTKLIGTPFTDAEKKIALLKIVEKFTPHLKNKELPLNMINGTAVIGIDVMKCVGRYYK